MRYADAARFPAHVCAALASARRFASRCRRSHRRLGGHGFEALRALGTGTPGAVDKYSTGEAFDGAEAEVGCDWRQRIEEEWLGFELTTAIGVRNADLYLFRHPIDRELPFAPEVLEPALSPSRKEPSSFSNGAQQWQLAIFGALQARFPPRRGWHCYSLI